MRPYVLLFTVHAAHCTASLNKGPVCVIFRVMQLVNISNHSMSLFFHAVLLILCISDARTFFLIEEQKNADSQFNWHLKRRQPCIHVKYSRCAALRLTCFDFFNSLFNRFDYMRTNRDSDLLDCNEIPMLLHFSTTTTAKTVDSTKYMGLIDQWFAWNFKRFNTDSMWEHLFFSNSTWMDFCVCSDNIIVLKEMRN